MTAHIAQNDGLFSTKRRLTLYKTTGCFQQTHGSSTRPSEKGNPSIKLYKQREENLKL